MNILHEQAKSVWPVEACAILIGTTNKETVVINEVFLVANSDKSPISFKISAQDTIRAYDRADELESEVVGVFHSHPAPPFPSSTDLQFMRQNPVVWVIMSMPSGVMKAHRLTDNNAEEIELRVTSN